MTIIDTFTMIGKNHKTCDDYIISGEEPFPYIILSDGCSSSKQTDMGSRILCHVAEKVFKDKMKEYKFIEHPEEFGEAVIYRAKAVADQLNLNDAALDATLMLAYIVDKKLFYFIYGDGSIIYFNEEYMQCSTLKYDLNAPKYLSYRLSRRREEQYKNMLVKKYLIANTSSAAPDPQPLEINNDVYCHSNVFYTSMINNFDGALFSTDGIDSFLSPEKSISQLEVAKVFTSFKTKTGEFLKRRVNRGIIELNQQGFHNYDDLSMGCFLREV